MATGEPHARRWQWLLAAAAVTGFVLVQYHEGWLGGRFWLGWDNGFQNYPWHAWQHARPAATWLEPVRELSGGLPLWVEPQSATFYPFNPAWWKFLDPMVAFNLGILFHLWLGGIGMLLLARELRLGPLAATVAAIAFCGGSFMVHRVSYWPMLRPAIWLPWIAWALRRGVAPGGEPWLFAAGLCAGLQVLAGHPQFIIPTAAAALAAGWTATPAELAQSRRAGRLLGRYLAVLGGGLALAAVVWIPAQQHVAAGPRQGATTVEWLTMWGCHFHEAFVNLLGGLPCQYKHEKTNFVGTVALVGLTLPWLPGGPRQWRIWSLAGLVGLLVSWSVGNPFWNLAVEVPLLNRFRAVARYGLLYSTAGALLAGLVVDQLGQLGRRPVAVAGGLVAAALALALAVAPHSEFTGQPTGVWLQIVVLGIACGAAVASADGRRVGLVRGLVTVAVAVELLVFGWRVNPALTREEWRQTPDMRLFSAAAEALPEPTAGFVAWRNQLPTNVSVLTGVRQPVSFAGFPYPGNEEASIVFRGPNSPALLAAFGLSLLAAERTAGEAAGFLPLRPLDDLWLFANPLPPLEAYVPRRLTPLTAESLTATLRSPTADPAALTAVPADLIPADYRPEQPATVRVVASSVTTMSVAVATETATLLVVNRFWSPDHLATVDGRPARCERVNLTQIAVPVPAGGGLVVLTSEPDLDEEARLSLGALLLWCLGLAVSLHRRRGTVQG